MSTGIDLQQALIDVLVSLGLTQGVAKAIWIPLPMIVMVLVASVFALVCTWLERKISAAAQQRIGPEYMGPFGVLVPLADVGKLIIKESVTPAKADPNPK